MASKTDIALMRNFGYNPLRNEQERKNSSKEGSVAEPKKDIFKASVSNGLDEDSVNIEGPEQVIEEVENNAPGDAAWEAARFKHPEPRVVEEE